MRCGACEGPIVTPGGRGAGKSGGGTRGSMAFGRATWTAMRHGTPPPPTGGGGAVLVAWDGGAYGQGVVRVCGAEA